MLLYGKQVFLTALPIINFLPITKI